MCPICKMWVRLQAGTGDQSSEFITVSPVLLSTAHSPGAELEAKYLPCQYTDTSRQHRWNCQILKWFFKAKPPFEKIPNSKWWYEDESEHLNCRVYICMPSLISSTQNICRYEPSTDTRHIWIVIWKGMGSNYGCRVVNYIIILFWITWYIWSGSIQILRPLKIGVHAPPALRTTHYFRTWM